MDKLWKCVSCSLVKERRDIREEVLEVYGLLDSALAELSSLEELGLISEQHSSWADQMVDMIHSCKSGLRFFSMLLMSIFTLEDICIPVNRICEAIRGISDFISPSYLANANHTFEAKWGISRNNRLEDAKLEFGNWILDVQGRIQRCKLRFEKSCELLLQCSLRCSFLENNTTLDFLDAILVNLKDLYKYKTDDEINLLKNQIEILDKKLTLLRNLFDQTPKEWSSFKETREFKVVAHAFAQYSASLIFLYWVKAVDEEMATKLNLLLFNVLQKINPCAPVFKAFYIRFLKEMKLGQLDSLHSGQIIHIFLDFLLGNLVDILKDDFQILQESLMFVIAFLANPPNLHAKDDELIMITTEIEGLVIEDLYCVLSVDDMKGEGNFSKANTFLSDVIRKVQLVKGKVQQVYDQIRDSFPYDFPKTNGLGFFDFLLQNLGFLKEKLNQDTDFIPFAKVRIIKIAEELMSLRPYLNDLFEQQKEQKELKFTWLKVINLAYQTEHAINSCLVGHQLWYNMARLMEVSDKIKVVKSKLKKIEGRKTRDGEVLHYSAVALNKVLEYPWASNEVMVGLEEEVDIIVGYLMCGSMSLKLVAIVGMAGLGKTTLANKVYKAPAVRNHFHMFAYCVVSQVHNVRKILLDILCDIKGKDDKMYDMIDEDLADILRKCLKGKRYLIIIDDIWDVDAWVEVERSLPNDQNGSRVIFTTRIHNVALQAKKDCNLHHLRFLSEKESWELLRKKAFRGEGCPPDFTEIGKTIAKNCKGLPLTIVLIAGLLARTKRSLSWWKKISETVGSYVSTEGCMDMLELSYQHLPEHLKSCFLYFAAFAEDALIRVNKLTLLWIAEGFVQNSDGENLKDVARKYLYDLVDRSLVIANERSSYGGIKSCRIHDLVHEFCQRKAQEDNFFQLLDGYVKGASDSSSSIVRNPYRVCIHMKGRYLRDVAKVCPSIHSVLDSRKWEVNRHDCYDVSNLKLVQVMDLNELEWDTRFIPEIASLVHLRFMAISFLPESWNMHRSSEITRMLYISNLWNLEILILTGNRRSMLELPETIWNMTRLRHVDVGRCNLCSLGVKKREACPQMVNLESFSSPNISATKVLEDILQRSPSLRKLNFHYVEELGKTRLGSTPKGFHFPNLNPLSKLESLKVSCVATELCLHPFIFPSTLKKLSLSGGFLPWMYLSAISKMPCLEVLKLLDNAFIGHEWDMEDTEFPKLKFLKLKRLDLHEWIAFCESFPSLEVLVVSGCFKLNTIPPCFREMPTLKRIEVYGSHDAVAASIVEIQEAQKEFGNEELEVIVT